MLQQHIIDVQTCGEDEQRQGILVPLDLPDLKIVHPVVQTDGSIEVHVIGVTNGEACPTCTTFCENIHDIRRRVKRDLWVRTY